ncbi:VOC family protein [[Pseudomonas] boreopolis]|uniref:VOC family protein n=1 Tax=Xanthomonas boreopolis TaxID=86183 RepID=UPI003DA150AB
MAKVTGIGGVFFKSRNDNAALAAWYQKNLGMPLESWGGAILRWPDDAAEDKGLTVWHVASKDSQSFNPSDSAFMINYRVDDLDGLIAELRANGVDIVGGPESHENGKFAWIMDPDGNKLELWEPMNWDEKNKSA